MRRKQCGKTVKAEQKILSDHPTPALGGHIRRSLIREAAMPIVDVEILLRVPEGEELSEERLETLDEMGFDEASVSSRRKGQLILALSLDDADWEREAESAAEALVAAMADADLQDILLSD